MISKKLPCYYCRSVDVVKYGKRKTENLVKQLYHCNKCKRKFIEEKDFEKIKGGKKATKIIMDLYFRGLSLRSIRDHLKKTQDIIIDHSNILRRINKYKNGFKRKDKDYRKLAKKRNNV